tara:strand:- start:448 stop:606 length:159 start_codon:yes stop_codon:yes gene_type:complete
LPVATIADLDAATTFRFAQAIQILVDGAITVIVYTVALLVLGIDGTRTIVLA